MRRCGWHDRDHFTTPLDDTLPAQPNGGMSSLVTAVSSDRLPLAQSPPLSPPSGQRRVANPLLGGIMIRWTIEHMGSVARTCPWSTVTRGEGRVIGVCLSADRQLMRRLRAYAGRAPVQLRFSDTITDLRLSAPVAGPCVLPVGSNRSVGRRTTTAATIRNSIPFAD
jgi:hypothetical protein